MDTELQAWLQSHGQTFTPDLSESHAFKSYKNENGKGWYIYKRYNDAIVFTFGDWKTGDKYTFKSTSDLDPSDPEYIALQEKAEALREEKARDARLHALSELNKSGQNMMTPYLEKKGFTYPHPTLHQILNHFGEMDLLVPMQDASGEIWNFQRIEPEGTKSFLEGGRTKGLYHLLRPVPESGVIYLVEGVSTGLSVLSLVEEGACVVVAFSATNLIHVAKLLREKHPTHKIIVCADNDHLKDLNFGLKAACDACLAVGAEIIYPPFTVKQPGTDWNDLILDLGFDNAKKEFARQLGTPNSITDLVETNYGKEIKPKKKRTKKTNSKSQTEFVEPTTEEQVPPSAAAPSDLQLSGPSGELDESVPEVVREETNISTSALVSGTTTSELEETEEDEGSADLGAGETTAKANYREFVAPYVNGLVPLKFKGKKNMPNEQQVAHYVKEYYGENIQTSEEGELFSIHAHKPHPKVEVYTPKNYQDTHWRYAEDTDTKILRRQIMSAYNGEATSSKVESTLRILKTLLPTLPEYASPWSPDPFKCNFANGTLHIVYKPGAKPGETKYSFEFKEHNAKDFVFYTNPLKFDTTLTAKNTEFTDMINRFFDKDPEADDKIRLLKQMYGACIAPIFPRIFMLLGPPGSGKSSTLIPAQRLVHKSNWCSVEPYQMNGFNLESMVGKLVNFVGDMHVTEPINDGIIKQLIDRMPFTVNRKYKTALKVPLPAIHIFAGNDAPPTLNRSSDVMDRRMSMIRMDKMRRTKEATHNFANEVFDYNPTGVLSAFAIPGLIDLLESGGVYHTFKSDRDMVREWQGLNDPIVQFLNAIKEGDVTHIQITGTAIDTCARSLLWEKYQKWNEASNGGRSRIAKHKFTKALEEKGHPCTKIHGGTFAFHGLKLIENGV